MRRAAKRDISEALIVGVLRQLGWSVLRISDRGAPDLCISKGAHCCLVEVKTGKGKLTPDQARFFSEWRGVTPLIFRDAQDAIDFNATTLRRIQ